jgi:5-methylcytosine-specific restriction endonuclease McrA
MKNMAPTYIGSICLRGHTERLVSNGACVECLVILRKRHAAKNREKIAKQKQKWVEENRQKSRGIKAAWRARNPEKSRACTRSWQRANPDKVAAKSHRRRTQVSGAGGSYTHSDKEDLIRRQKRKCAYCRSPLSRKNHQVDHITPVSLGGSSNPSNLQILCSWCNQSKGALDPIEYAKKIGRLV